MKRDSNAIPKPLGDACVPFRTASPAHAGILIVNADDWGRNRETTERTLDCFLLGAVSSVSAMVFMEDSERAAAVARENAIDTGLHLNFTTPFTAPGTSSILLEHQSRVSGFLRRWRFAQVLYHPGLSRSFQYLAAAQRDEFCRLYGSAPDRYDGHHHMHLCANVLLGELLPRGAVVRRNFSFRPGEKGLCNRSYRRVVDSFLGRRYRLADCFFSLAPVEPRSRLETILSLARDYSVEIETHLINSKEYRFLAEGGLLGGSMQDLFVAPRFILTGDRQANVAR